MRVCGGPAVRADRSWSRLYNTLSRVIYGLREVQISAQEEREIERYHRDSERYVRYGTEYQINYAVYGPTFGLITQIGTLAIWGLGCLALIQHHLTIGEMTAFLGYLGYFYGPVTQLSNIAGQIVSARTAAERVFEVLDAEVEVAAPTEPQHLGTLKGRIEFRDVVFSYNGRENALDGINLTIEPGEKIGLVGLSGCGKTTLANLVGYFYKPTRGEVHIDGVNLRDIDPTELRRQVAMVLQDPVIFPGTIAENIAYGRPDASLDAIIDVAKKANAHEFISKMSDSYDTQVGDRGLGLSGGQRQRISIARALLQDPRILVLDEPTAALDAESEALIQQALEGLMEGRTTIIIAHRLPTLRFTDRIVVLEKGRVEEQGSYDELMAQDGLFHKLWNLQMRENTVNGRFTDGPAARQSVFDVELLTFDARLREDGDTLTLEHGGQTFPVEVVCAQPVRAQEHNVILQGPDGKLYFLPRPDSLTDAASREVLHRSLDSRYPWRIVADVQHVRYKSNGRITFCVNLADGDRDIFDVAGMAHLHRINGSLLVTSTRGTRYYISTHTCPRPVRERLEGLTV
jgi:ABC-type transport system involved in Fe-S cluster assembly fused permease/ATPase subunit